MTFAQSRGLEQPDLGKEHTDFLPQCSSDQGNSRRRRIFEGANNSPHFRRVPPFLRKFLRGTDSYTGYGNSNSDRSATKQDLQSVRSSLFVGEKIFSQGSEHFIEF